MMRQAIEAATKIEIVSGEGVGEGAIEIYTGKRTERAIKSRLTKECCNGDRWAFVRFDGHRF